MGDQRDPQGNMAQHLHSQADKHIFQGVDADLRAVKGGIGQLHNPGGDGGVFFHHSFKFGIIDILVIGQAVDFQGRYIRRRQFS